MSKQFLQSCILFVAVLLLCCTLTGYASEESDLPAAREVEEPEPPKKEDLITEGVGLQLSFNRIPLFISRYDDPPDKLSLAMTPTSFPRISRKLTFSSKATSSTFDNESIRFETMYYRRGREAEYLIPLSVDAREYDKYRRNSFFKREYQQTLVNTITSDDKKKKSSGLGINVALPKRLQKIFGEGDAGLKVSGYRKIMFSGRSSWTDKDQSDAFEQSKFPTLRMDQISRFDITGTIGTKITVKVSQDSQVDLPLANRIQIRYKGDEDDILKSIEAGNTTLSLPNKEFVGYSSQIRGLFGLKAEAQIGNLSLIGIASQEKGSTEKTSISATGEENAEFTRDYEYEQRRIFDLALPGELDTGDSILQIFMYESTNPNQVNLEAKFANFYVDPNNKTLYSSENNANGGTRAQQISNDSYTLFTVPDSNKHYVYFKSNRSTSYYIGCWIKYLDASTGLEVTIGDIDDTRDTMDLKLLCPSSSQELPTNATWDLMWRNTYSVPRGVDISDLDMKIFKGLAGTETNKNNLDYQENENDGSQQYIEILGLDQYNSQGVKNPDNLIDERQSIYRSDWGLIIFPEREPFNSSRRFQHENGAQSDTLLEKVPSIYNYDSYQERLENSKYYLQVSSKSRSSIIKLNRVNIIEGSEQVTANGQRLAKGTDYNIDYDFGQITLLSDVAMDPNADLRIDFEYAPFFAVQKKTLLGFRADYEWSRDLNFGTTILYKSDKAQERKPKVGQETARMVVFDADISWKLHPNFLTSVVDALPLIETEAPSNLALSAEVAQSHPNPNVDNIAYVDDFETSSDLLSLGLFRVDWSQTTTPYQLSNMNYSKGKMMWYTPAEDFAISEIYNKETAAGEGTARVLQLKFRPQNYMVDTLDMDTANCVVNTADTMSSSSWGGIMRYFGNRVDADRAKLFEMRIRPYAVTASGTSLTEFTGKIHFEFGLISEDLNNDASANNEDNIDFNEVVSEEEDVGLDGKADVDELCYDQATNPDPAGDNYWFKGKGINPLPRSISDTVDWNDETHPLYFEYINGTEGNLDDGLTSSRPDREALSPNKEFNTTNSYFSYSLDFNDPAQLEKFLVDSSVFYPEADDPRYWATFQIPIRDTANLLNDRIVTDGSTEPSWSRITYVRVWIETDQMETNEQYLDVAHWGFVQTNWKDSTVIADPVNSLTEFIVSTISDEDNSYSDVHPDIEPYEDPTTNVTEPQRALQLEFNNLDARDSVFVTKELLSVDTYSGYGKMQMYVHANDDIPLDRVQFYFRLGTDDNNWYEYYTYLRPNWDEQNFLDLDFEELTALKDSALRSIEVNQTIDTVVSNDNYRFLGSPNLNEIRFFTMGVINTDTLNPVSGRIWLDELRVTDVRKDVGTAGRISASGNLADLITYNFTLRSKDPYFRGISAATRGGSSNNLGSGRQETSYSMGMTLNFDKFLPRSWGARLPISVSYAKTIQTPLLKTNSDIILPEESRVLEQTVSESRSFSVSASFNKKGSNPLFSVLLNRMKTRFSYRRNTSKSPNVPYSFGENYDITGDYNLSMKEVPKLPIFFWTKSIPLLKKTTDSRLSLYPETWTMAARYNRNLRITEDKSNVRRPTITRDFTGTMKIAYRVFDNLSTSFDYSTTRDLSNLDDVNIVWDPKKFKLGVETRYSQRFNSSYDPKLLSFFTTKFGYNASYSDDWERSTSSRRSSMGRGYSVSGEFNHMILLGGTDDGRNKRISRGTGRRSQAKKDGEDDEADDGNKGPAFYEYPIIGLRFLTSWVDPFKYSYSKNFNKSLPGMLTRPHWKYRFGLADDPEVETTSDIRSPASDEGEAYEVSTGFTFLGGLTTTIRFKQSIRRDLFVVGRNKQKSISTNWPDLTIRIQKFSKLPLIKGIVNKFIEVFSPRTGFSRSVKETHDMDAGFLLNKSTSRNHNPLLSVNFRLYKSLSLNSTYTYSITEQEAFNQLSGNQESTSRSIKKSLSLSTNYSFSSPTGISIPLFGKLKFRSQVDISVNLKISNQTSETERPGQEKAVSEDKSAFDIAPNIAYTFSRQIRGGITLRWQDTSDNYRDTKNHVREVQLWTEIRF